MATAYIETTIPSYKRSGFDLVASTETLNECGEGDPGMARSRLALLTGIRVLPVVESAVGLARTLVASGLVPVTASPHAVHIALATVHNIDLLVTWSFKHIANPHIWERALQSTIRVSACQ